MYLKKVKLGNPLMYLGMFDLVDEYNQIRTDEELAKFYHRLLDMAEARNSNFFTEFIYAMIAFSTGKNINAKMLIQ